jgi:hypothetical protein
MEKLNQKLWSIVNEYTRQVAELLDCSEWHWIGTDDDGVEPASVCDFDGAYFLSLEDMQIIVDRLDEWVGKYGNKDAVADKVRGWFEWYLDDHDEKDSAVQIVENRRGRYLRTYPRINLKHWLMGCQPPDKYEPSLHEHLCELKAKRELVTELIQAYRPCRSLWNVIDGLTAEIKTMEEKVKVADEKAMDEIRQSEAYQNFEKTINEYDNGKF